MKFYALILPAALVAAPALAADPAAPAQPAAPAAAAPAPAPASTGTVARAQFTSAIKDREPIDSLNQLGNDQNRIYFFTELKGFNGQGVAHRWEFNGQVMYEQKFDVGSDRWRVFSSKTLDPLWLGEWKVSVVDGSGATVSASTFTYTKAAAAPAAPAPAPAAAPKP
jgi:hypothetical protein